jgi:anaerobic selenocysteine-containing dehydrogenase
MYADIVIPSKFDIESTDIINSYYLPGLSINIGGPCPYPNCLSNFEFYKKLAEKMGWREDPEFNEDDNLIVENCLNLLPSNFRTNIKTNGYHVLFDINSVPFKEMLFPTFNKKINLQNLTLDFGFEWVDLIRRRKKNTFILISPSHKYYIHSQLGQIHNHYLDDFNNIYLSDHDIKSLNLKEGQRVLVSNRQGQGEYFIARTSILDRGIALIYSGAPFESTSKFNVNIFTPDLPEELGFSGSYNSTLVEINNL